MAILVERGNERLPFTVTPQLDDKTGVGVAGWAEKTEIEVGGLVAGMDAARKGLQAGDLLVSINSRPINTAFSIHEELKRSDGKPVDLVYRRAGKESTVSITPSFSTDLPGGNRWMIGVELAPRVTFSRLGPVEAVRESVSQNMKGATLIYQFIHALLERRSSPSPSKGLSASPSFRAKPPAAVRPHSST